MGGKKPKKAAFAGSPPRPTKTPATAADPHAYRQMKPQWSFRYADHSGPWSWDRLDGDVSQAFTRLRDLEPKTWFEVSRLDSCGEIPVEQLCDEAQQRLVDIQLDQFDTLYKLQVTGAKRVWGIRIEQVFHFLWWDPTHSVYPMNRADN